MEISTTLWGTCLEQDFTLLICFLVCQLPQYVVTRDGVSSSDYMAQYILSVILAGERHLIEHHRNQQVRLW